MGQGPKTNKRMAVMTLIEIKGTNTINHEIIPKPREHNIFNTIVNIIIIINLKKAVLYKFLNKSIII